MGQKSLRLLFIGNSHTYVNGVPHLVATLAREEGIPCEVTMLASGGWFLDQHVDGKEAGFNILYGHYDCVILQENSHLGDEPERFLSAVRQLCEWIREAGAVPVLYSTWAFRNAPERQEGMNALYAQAAEENRAVLVPVGWKWWDYKAAHPGLDLYAGDGQHASEAGSAFAAKNIWETIADIVKTGS